jgi:hypothetical protein
VLVLLPHAIGHSFQLGSTAHVSIATAMMMCHEEHYGNSIQMANNRHCCLCWGSPSISPLSGALSFLQVLNDLKWNLVRPQGLEAVMRVRCSQGLDVSSYSGG